MLVKSASNDLFMDFVAEALDDFVGPCREQAVGDPCLSLCPGNELRFGRRQLSDDALAFDEVDKKLMECFPFADLRKDVLF